MTISSFQAAKALGRFSDWSLSNLEIQKILYLSHMLHMGRTGGERLISESFEAWDYGPVLPRLYHKLKIFGSDPVKDIFSGAENISDDCPEAILLKEGCAHLAGARPGKLVALTHREGGAWDKNYQSGKRGIKIPDADILEEYRILQ